MDAARTRITQGGRVVIPAEYRRALGLREGDEVVLYLDQGQVRIVTPERAIELAQEIVRQYIPPGRSLVDDLIAERRREAAGE